MGICSQPVVENSACKLAQGKDSNFKDTVNIGPESFLSVIKQGKSRACCRNGHELTIVGGVLHRGTCTIQDPAVLDLSVCICVENGATEKQWWSDEGFNLNHVVVKGTFHAKNNEAKAKQKKR